jgi:predicted metal-dependent phosphoesterase TrpH
VAVTDHDTLSGIGPARAAARPGLEVIAGVEITAEAGGREVHLLGLFVRPDDPPLVAALHRLREGRRGRFREMVGRLRGRGVSVDEGALAGLGETTTLGRRNLAMLLHESGQVGSVREAFDRYLGDGGPADVAKERLPLAEAVSLVRGAGGVASLAHPPANLTMEGLAVYRDLGLQAVEAAYPSFKAARAKELRRWAAELGLAVTGGSDCHGPGAAGRGVGAEGITAAELVVLRELAMSAPSGRGEVR